jgi:hypothetical protein
MFLTRFSIVTYIYNDHATALLQYILLYNSYQGYSMGSQMRHFHSHLLSPGESAILWLHL